LTDQSTVFLPRGEIIRKISVFISSLEWVARPGEGNYDLCQGAKVLLEKVLDSILDANPIESASAIQTAPVDPVLWVDELFGSGWMNSSPFINSIGAIDAPSWDAPGNWPLEF
jgi:hypothetical protein